jgi:23S rRNA pseudouridine1911/1915/1917 synthase
MDTKLKHNNLCSLKSYNTLKEFLNKELLFSSSSIKRIITNKKFLQREVREKDELDISLNLLNQNIVNPIHSGDEIEIIQETEDYLVLNKPEFSHGHPLNYEETGTVLNFLRSRFKDLGLGLASDEKERGLLYRLDEQTSGVLIYVKDKNKHQELRRNFNSAMKKKSYLAIVEGHLEINSEVVNFLKGSGEKGSKVIESEEGERCKSHISSLKYYKDKNVTLVKVDLETGFRHQIRVQLANLSHPIVGDTLYGAKEEKRIYLHAFEYCIGESCWRAENNLLFSNFLNLNSLLDVF